jgi:hypothetical protein
MRPKIVPVASCRTRHGGRRRCPTLTELPLFAGRTRSRRDRRMFAARAAMPCLARHRGHGAVCEFTQQPARSRGRLPSPGLHSLPVPLVRAVRREKSTCLEAHVAQVGPHARQTGHRRGTAPAAQRRRVSNQRTERNRGLDFLRRWRPVSRRDLNQQQCECVTPTQKQRSNIVAVHDGGCQPRFAGFKGSKAPGEPDCRRTVRCPRPAVVAYRRVPLVHGDRITHCREGGGSITQTSCVFGHLADGDLKNPIPAGSKHR